MLKTGGGKTEISDFQTAAADHGVFDFRSLLDVHRVADARAHVGQHGSDLIFDFGNGDVPLLENVAQTLI